MEQPPACVAIQGVIRAAFVEEHSTIRKHLSAGQSSDTDISKSIESKGENIGVINGHVLDSGSSGDDDGSQQVENNGNSIVPISEASFYKLEMIKIQVFSAQGQPVSLLTCMFSCDCLETTTMNSCNRSFILFILTDPGALPRNLLPSPS